MGRMVIDEFQNISPYPKAVVTPIMVRASREFPCAVHMVYETGLLGPWKTVHSILPTFQNASLLWRRTMDFVVEFPYRSTQTKAHCDYSIFVHND